jgi:hypothetical protein
MAFNPNNGYRCGLCHPHIYEVGEKKRKKRRIRGGGLHLDVGGPE